MIEIRETATELLLYIPASQKERARAIEGRRWEPERRCWVYPKTRRMYDALIGEFGDDVVPGSVPPAPSVSPGEPRGEGNGGEQRWLDLNESLQSQLQDLRDALDLLRQPGHGPASAAASDLYSTLVTKESEIAGLRARLREQENHVAEARVEAARLREQLDQEHQENTVLRNELVRQQESTMSNGRHFTAMIRGLAVETSGNDEWFQQIITDVRLTRDFAMLMVPRLEHALRDVLGIDDEDRVSLFEMISQARDGQLLTEDAIDMAHLLRKQGNILKHGKPEPRTIPARGLLSLYAAAILWPELSIQSMAMDQTVGSGEIVPAPQT
jgi:hypothetical protein